MNKCRVMVKGKFGLEGKLSLVSVRRGGGFSKIGCSFISCSVLGQIREL